MAGKLSKVQKKVLQQMQGGSVIGELSDKINGRYELFVRQPLVKDPESRYVVKLERLNKNTVFALMALDLIREDNEIAESMLPYGRDHWYVINT